MARRRSAEEGLTALAMGLLLAWDTSGLDLRLARLSGSEAGFALRENWWLAHLLHDSLQRLGWAFALLLCLGVWWPRGALRGLPPGARLQLACGPLVAAAAVALLKSINASPCPWDLVEFGGLARQLPHWRAFLSADGGAGHCFPAGHASAAFAFVGGWFVFRERQPRLARAWLLLALAAGLLLGLMQQLRGAHFMSHTLWSGLLCWGVAGLLDLVWPRSTGWLGSTPGQGQGPSQGAPS